MLRDAHVIVLTVSATLRGFGKRTAACDCDCDHHHGQGRASIGCDPILHQRPKTLPAGLPLSVHPRTGTAAVYLPSAMEQSQSGAKSRSC